MQITSAGIGGLALYISSPCLRKEESEALGSWLTSDHSGSQDAFLQHATGYVPNPATLEQTPACHHVTNGLLMAPPSTLQGFTLTWPSHLAAVWTEPHAASTSTADDSNLVGTSATIHTHTGLFGLTYLDRVPPTTVPTSGTV